MTSIDKKVTAADVAKYIVGRFQDCQDPVTNLKLQKLLYYVQGWHLGIFGEPVFDEEFQAWVHGPVVPGVFQTYKENRWNPIIGDVERVELAAELKAHVDEVLDVYGGDSGWALELRTHREAPWKDARGAIPPDESSTAIISKDAMKSFFKKLDSDGQNQKNG